MLLHIFLGAFGILLTSSGLLCAEHNVENLKQCSCIFSGCIWDTFDKFCVKGGRSRKGFLFSSDLRRYVLCTVAQNLSKVSQLHPDNMQTVFFWDVRRYVLRTVAQNLSKVSQMHPEHVQEHVFRFSTLCSAHSSPELLKSIPSAPRKYARPLLGIFDVMFCAQ